MPRLFSKLTTTSPAATSLALLILRIASGGFLAIGHGLAKLRNATPSSFPDPLGIGHAPSYYGAVAAELGCGLLVALGLLTRLATLPCLFTMLVAIFAVHGKDPFFASGPGPSKEPAAIYLAMFLTILLAGPGRYSIDHALARPASPR